MRCYSPEWGVNIWDRVLVNGMGCYYTGWGCCMGWGVSKLDGVLLFGMGC